MGIEIAFMAFVLEGCFAGDGSSGTRTRTFATAVLTVVRGCGESIDWAHICSWLIGLYWEKEEYIG